MNLTMMIIEYVLRHESTFMTERTLVTLQNAVKLMNTLPSYYADDAVKALFSEEVKADVE